MQKKILLCLLIIFLISALLVGCSEINKILETDIKKLLKVESKNFSKTSSQGVIQHYPILENELVSVTDKGYTVTIHRVAADAVETRIEYSVKGPDPDSYSDFTFSRIGAHNILFNGKKPFEYSSCGDSTTFVGDTLVGKWTTDPLPAAEGEMEIRIYNIGSAIGKWILKFPVTMAATRTYEINEKIVFDGGVFTVTRLEVTPDKTGLRFQCDTKEDILSFCNRVSLHTKDQLLQSRSFQGGGQTNSDGSFSYEGTYIFSHSELDEGAEATITLEMSQLPLVVGEKIILSTGGELEVISIDIDDKTGQGSAVIATDFKFEKKLPPDEWSVRDYAGYYYYLVSMTEHESGYEFSWQIPAVSKPEFLENQTNPLFYEVGSVTFIVPAPE
ncbi:MAG: DUF4179 domain-containing protein [Dethiobacteraceae bacterium]|jgi:hypothetical protein